MSNDLRTVRLEGDEEVEQAARILVWTKEAIDEHEAKIKGLKAQQDEARSLIQDAMGGDDSEPAEATFGGRVVARWTKYQTHRLDSKALKKAHPEIHDEFYIESDVRRFSILPPAEDKS